MTSKIKLTDNLKMKTIIHALRSGGFLSNTKPLTTWSNFNETFLSLHMPACALWCSLASFSLCRISAIFVSALFSWWLPCCRALAQLFKSHWATGTQIKFYNLHHFFSGTIAYNFFPLNSLFLQHYSVNPIIICIITLFLYVLSLPTIVPVTEGRNISLHHHPML